MRFKTTQFLVRASSIALYNAFIEDLTKHPSNRWVLNQGFFEEGWLEARVGQPNICIFFSNGNWSGKPTGSPHGLYFAPSSASDNSVVKVFHLDYEYASALEYAIEVGQELSNSTLRLDLEGEVVRVNNETVEIMGKCFTHNSIIELGLAVQNLQSAL